MLTKTTSLLLLLALAAALSPIGCKSHRTRTVTEQRIHTYHMSDGSIGYQGSDGFWYWYGYTTLLGGDCTANCASSTTATGTSGAWYRGSSPYDYPRPGVRVVSEKDEKEETLEEEVGQSLPEAAHTEEVSIEEPDSAHPNDEGTTTVANPEDEPQGESNSEPASESSGSSDSGSSDSGDGGGGGDD